MSHIYIGDRQLEPDEEEIPEDCDLTWEEIQQKKFDDFDPPETDFGGDL